MRPAACDDQAEPDAATDAQKLIPTAGSGYYPTAYEYWFGGTAPAWASPGPAGW